MGHLESGLPALFKRIRDPLVVLELGVGFGIADAVLFDIDYDSMAARMAGGLRKPVLSSSHLSVLTTLTASGPISLDLLGASLSFSRSNLRSHILKTLEDQNLVAISPDGTVEMNDAFKSVSRYVIAVEAKLRDWKRAIGQAVRYRWFANESYVALPAGLARRPDVAALSALNGIGLISVESSRLRLVSAAPRSAPDSPVFERFAGERVLDHLLKTA